MKIGTLLANRIVSVISASIFSLFIIWMFKGDYLKYVAATSICLVVLAFTYQWSLFDIVSSSNETIGECLHRYRTRQKHILFCTLLIVPLILLSGNSNDKISLVLIGISFVLYTISNEGLSHMATRMSLLKINIYANLFKIIFAIFLFKFSREEGWASVSLLLLICAITNFIGQYLILKTEAINARDNSDLQFSWENFSRSVSFLIAGASLQIDRLFTRIIENDSANGMVYIISDYANLTMGFVAGTLYWYYIKKYINNRTIIFAYSIVIYIGVVFFSLAAQYIPGAHLDYAKKNMTDYIGFEGALIVLLSIPAIIKTFVLEPLAMSLNISKKVAFINIFFLAAYISCISFLETLSAINLILVKGILGVVAGLLLINFTRGIEPNKNYKCI